MLDDASSYVKWFSLPEIFELVYTFPQFSTGFNSQGAEKWGKRYWLSITTD